MVFEVLLEIFLDLVSEALIGKRRRAAAYCVGAIISTCGTVLLWYFWANRITEPAALAIGIGITMLGLATLGFTYYASSSARTQPSDRLDDPGQS
jgi:hypothetical protein